MVNIPSKSGTTFWNEPPKPNIEWLVSGKLLIREVLLSPVLSELMELRQVGPASYDDDEDDALGAIPRNICGTGDKNSRKQQKKNWKR